MANPPRDRSALMQLLNDIPAQQLDMLLFAVDAPNNVIPPLTAPQGDRVAALLRWTESPTGRGLQVLQQELAKIIPLPKNEIVPEELWNIPYPRNLFFTGRETVLQDMRNALLAKKSAAFSGLGGIGKTQTAIEFAYRYR
ncbi:MAG: hypothetical protein RMY34_31345 [Aulosira sp. DedQUE10]|nr:hypothetical protein [Aulosira sp. DedQUE10]